MTKGKVNFSLHVTIWTEKETWNQIEREGEMEREEEMKEKKKLKESEEREVKRELIAATVSLVVIASPNSLSSLPLSPPSLPLDWWIEKSKVRRYSYLRFNVEGKRKGWMKKKGLSNSTWVTLEKGTEWFRLEGRFCSYISSWPSFDGSIVTTWHDDRKRNTSKKERKERLRKK